MTEALASPRSDVAAAPTLDEVFAGLGREASRPRRFVERRHSVLFTEPEESRGVLEFKPPDTFEKRIEAPTAETLRLDGRTATIRRGQSAPMTLTLDAHPALMALAHGLRAASSGDLATLRAAFEVSLVTEDTRWRVLAVPRDPGASRLLERLELGGAGNRLDRIVLYERSGDRSEMWLLDDVSPR